VALERRVYFVAGDLIACASAGALAGVVSTVVVGPGWNVVLGLAAGMAIGMGVALVLSLLCFVIPFGAFEIMLPATLSGALAGMVVGMVGSLRDLSTEGSVTIGALLGIAVLVYTYGLNARLAGSVKTRGGETPKSEQTRRRGGA